ncbi:MAG: T9SS type A sorting domain-containing protein [Bacteroidetes bacterium]|nr:T9SS type A sorting domain-containing protein [Bacteroidota bacterium]
MKNLIQSVNSVKTRSLFFLLGVLIANTSIAQQLILSEKSGFQSKTESIEDWESGGLTQFDWQTGGTANWYVTNYLPYEGTYCARSGDINDGQNSWIQLTYDVYAAEDISFWIKVSSEASYDYLRFYIDGNELNLWSGMVAWQEVSFPVTVGTHVFKWQYDKDFSVSTGDDCAYIDFFVFPPMELQALFTSDTTVICEGDAVHYYDQSVGPITQWNWIFEGATPSTSTEQNPVVGYGTAGSYDVYLEVSDGIETAEIYMPNYITVGEVPGIAPTPTGLTLLCASWGNSSYNTSGISGITTYDWMLEPTEAGTISGNGTNITVIWDDEFLGVATLRVAGVNYCGSGIPSNPLNITRYLPVVTLLPFNNVSINTPPFQLTGGAPAGGTYSGPGVTGGIFDPAAAGLGTHTITYTYTDLNMCTNSAENTITVTLTTGVTDISGGTGVSVYPNPSNGMITVSLTSDHNQPLGIKVYNALNQVVYSAEELYQSGKKNFDFDLGNLQGGIYYLHVTGTEHNLVKKIILEK